jgi:uncharacterized protein (TIGR03435 family)
LRRPNDGAGPGLLAVLQQQLGLKFRESNGPVEVLAIDHLARDPIEN